MIIEHLKTREDSLGSTNLVATSNTQRTFYFIAVTASSPATDYSNIRYLSLNNRPVTVILKLIS